MAVAVDQISKGMQVRSSDGASLGKVADVWVGTDPTASNQPWDEDVCSRMEVQSGGLLHKEKLYIPLNAIAEVSGNAVTLKTAEAETRSKPGWAHKPAWIEA